MAAKRVTMRAPVGGLPSVSVSESHVKGLEAQGWVVEKPAPKKRTAKADQQDDKPDDKGSK